MPYRKTVIVPGEIYHVYNRSVARQPIFINSYDNKRALDIIEFYTYQDLPFRFSHYNRLPLDVRSKFKEDIERNHQKQILLLAFCLMSNHTHLLIQEVISGGITKFMANFQNSYAKYFNLKNERNGAVFQERFKAVRIETDEQLLHVCRYIHLNPLTAFILKEFSELEDYNWCSFLDYLNKRKKNFLNTDKILAYFPSLEKFISFTSDQVDYQRKLSMIEHLILE